MDAAYWLPPQHAVQIGNEAAVAEDHRMLREALDAHPNAEAIAALAAAAHALDNAVVDAWPDLLKCLREATSGREPKLDDLAGALRKADLDGVMRRAAGAVAGELPALPGVAVDQASFAAGHTYFEAKKRVVEAVAAALAAPRAPDRRSPWADVPTQHKLIGALTSMSDCATDLAQTATGLAASMFPLATPDLAAALAVAGPRGPKPAPIFLAYGVPDPEQLSRDYSAQMDHDMPAGTIVLDVRALAVQLGCPGGVGGPSFEDLCDWLQLPPPQQRGRPQRLALANVAAALLALEDIPSVGHALVAKVRGLGGASNRRPVWPLDDPPPIIAWSASPRFRFAQAAAQASDDSKEQADMLDELIATECDLVEEDAEAGEDDGLAGEGGGAASGGDEAAAAVAAAADAAAAGVDPAAAAAAANPDAAAAAAAAADEAGGRLFGNLDTTQERASPPVDDLRTAALIDLVTQVSKAMSSPGALTRGVVVCKSPFDAGATVVGDDGRVRLKQPNEAGGTTRLRCIGATMNRLHWARFVMSLLRSNVEYGIKDRFRMAYYCLEWTRPDTGVSPTPDEANRAIDDVYGLLRWCKYARRTGDYSANPWLQRAIESPSDAARRRDPGLVAAYSNLLAGDRTVVWADLSFFPASRGKFYSTYIKIGKHGKPMTPDQPYEIQGDSRVNEKVDFRLAFPKKPEENLSEGTESEPEGSQPEGMESEPEEHPPEGIQPKVCFFFESEADFNYFIQVDYIEAMNHSPDGVTPGPGLFGQYNAFFTGMGFPNVAARALLAYMRSKDGPFPGLRPENNGRLFTITDCNPPGLFIQVMIKIGTSAGALRCGPRRTADERADEHADERADEHADEYAQKDAVWLGVTPSMMMDEEKKWVRPVHRRPFSFLDNKIMRTLDGRIRQAERVVERTEGRVGMDMDREREAYDEFRNVRKKFDTAILRCSNSLMDCLEEEFHSISRLRQGA